MDIKVFDTPIILNSMCKTLVIKAGIFIYNNTCKVH